MPQKDSETEKHKVKSSAKKAGAESFKLGVRLLQPLNDGLRRRARYKGDLTKFIVEAIMEVELERVRLVVIDEPKIADTSIQVEKPVFVRLSTLAKKRGTSMNVLVNTAAAHWLDSKNPRVRYEGE